MSKSLSSYIASGLVVLLLAAAGYLLYQNSWRPGGESGLSDVSHDQLLSQLKTAGEDEDYETFGKLLNLVYKNQWDAEDEFQKTESAAYVKATEYYQAGDWEKSLAIATTVYDAAPFGWRFVYLRIVSLEKLGRAALERGDLAQAEQRAMTILQMQYRIEGANLLADIAIEKIKTALAAGNREAAIAELKEIWDFEVGPDRRAVLESYRQQLGVELK